MKESCDEALIDTDDGDGESETEAVNLMMFIRRNKLFFIVNLGVIGLYFSNSVLNNYMMQIVDGVGGTSEDMGRILSVMAFCEIPALVLSLIHILTAG